MVVVVGGGGTPIIVSVCVLKTIRETQKDKRQTQDTELDN